MTHEMLYWITRFDTIHEVSGVGMIILMFVTAFSVAGLFVLVETHDTAFAKIIAALIAIGEISLFALCMAAFIFIPTTKEAAAIYVVPKIANSEAMKGVEGLGCDIVQLAREYVKEQLDGKRQTTKNQSPATNHQPPTTKNHESN